MRLIVTSFTSTSVFRFSVPSVPGLMSRDVETLILVTKLLLDHSYHAKFDAEVLPIPWNEQVLYNIINPRPHFRHLIAIE